MLKQKTIRSTETTKSIGSASLPLPSTASEEMSRLQFEIVRLSTELTSCREQLNAAERRLDQSQRGRLRYKDLWSRALREVARLRADAEETTRTTLQRRDAEVEGLRERCLAINNPESSKQPHKIMGANGSPPASISQIRNELQRYVFS